MELTRVGRRRLDLCVGLFFGVLLGASITSLLWMSGVLDEITPATLTIATQSQQIAAGHREIDMLMREQAQLDWLLKRSTDQTEVCVEILESQQAGVDELTTVLHKGE